LSVDSAILPAIAAGVALLASYDVTRSATLGLAFFVLQSSGRTLLGTSGAGTSQVAQNIFGLLIGVILLVELDQACLLLFRRGIPLAVIVAISFVRVTWTNMRETLAAHRVAQPPSPRILILYLCAVFLLASRQHNWLLLVALSSVVLLLATHRHSLDSRVRFATVGLALIPLGIALRERPTYTPLITEEQIFYELLASSLSHSSAVQPTYASTSGIEYHWLANGLAGWLNREIGFQPFLLSSFVLPIVLGLMILCLVAALMRMDTRPFKHHVVVAGVAALWGYPIYFANPVGAINNFFSAQEVLMMALSIGSLVILTQESSVSGFQTAPVMAVLTYGSIGAGASAVITFVPGILVLLLVRVLTERRSATRRESLALIISVIASAVLALWRFHGYPNPSFSGGARIGIFPLFGFVGQMVGDLNELPGYQQAIARSMFALGIAAAPLTALLRPQVAGKPRTRLIVDYVLIAALVGVTVTQYGQYGINLRILTTALILALWVSALEVVGSSRRMWFFLWPMALAVVAWVVWCWLVATLQAGDIRSIQSRALLSATPALLLIAYLLGFGIVRLLRTLRQIRTSENRGTLRGEAWHAAAAALLTFGCLQGFSTTIQAYQYYQPRLSARITSLDSSVETKEAAEWLVSQPSDALIAVDDAGADIQLQHLIALSSRKFLLLGASLWDKNFLEDDDAARLLQLQRQLSSPSEALLQELAVEGVSHLLLRRDISKERIAELLGNPQFENHIWSVYRLPSDSDTERSG
jgi:hypothetical protein